MDGAGAQWGRKAGPPDSYLEPLNPYGSPLFFGFQKPFLFPAGKRNGFCRPHKVRFVLFPPDGENALRSLARPLAARPTSLGSRGGPIFACGLARRVVAPRAKAVHPKTFPPQGGRWMAKGQTDEGALDRTKGKSVLPAHPHPPQCAHWGTFPLAGGRFYGRAIRGPGKRAPQ